MVKPITQPLGHFIELQRWLVLLGLYLAILWSAWPEGGCIRHPIHHDDYYALTRTWDDITSHSIRPVSWAIFAAINRWLPTLAHVALAVLFVTTAWLAIRFAELFALDGNRISTAALLTFGLLAFGLPASIDYTTYLGLITNISSALFGLTSMCLMASAALKPARKWLYLVPAWISAVACGFAKEDFALALVITAVTVAWAARQRLWAANAVAIAALSVLGTLKSRAMGSPFISGSTSVDAPYFIDISIGSLFDVAMAYLRQSGYLPLLLLALFIAMIALAQARESRATAFRLLALTLIAVSPLVPYLVLPNHTFGFYTLYPGVLAAAAIATTTGYGLATPSPRLTGRATAFHIGMLGIACLLVAWHQPQRAAIASWYSDQSLYNSRITRFCQHNAPLLAGRDVAVHGVSGFSPWHTGAAEYLYRRLRLDTRWHLIVRKGESAGPESTGQGWSTSVHCADAIPLIARSPHTTQLVIAPDGCVSVAQNLEEAIRLSQVDPVVHHVLPEDIRRSACADGFSVVLVGHGFVPSMSLQIDGESVPLTVHRLGDLATCWIQASSRLCEKEHVSIKVSLGNRNVLSHEIPIK